MTGNVFITGAASGIGRETAIALYDRGWHVGAADVDLQGLNDLATGRDPARMTCFTMDVTVADQVREAMNAFTSHNNGKLDLLINNAGVLFMGRFEDVPLALHHKTIDINLHGVLSCCHSAFSALKKSERGLVINLCSASSLFGVPELASYAASKSAIRSLTEGLELEWKKHGIMVCDVVPPFIKTPMLGNQQHPAKILDRMGVDLLAADVVRTILRQLDRPKLHRPVSARFALLAAVSSVMPDFVNRLLMKILGT